MLYGDCEALLGYLDKYRLRTDGKSWHNVLSRADGPRSVMYPTASGFLGQAVAKHGMLIGITMTADRLLHEWDEQQRAPRIIKYGISRAYDPVEANDFWWGRGEE